MTMVSSASPQIAQRLHQRPDGIVDIGDAGVIAAPGGADVGRVTS